MARDFTARVLTVVRRIPVGRVATYGDIATLAGRPRAARAVGTVMRECRDASVPCHRVVASGGQLGGYGGSEALKAQLLSLEGIRVSGRRIRAFDRVRWSPTALRPSRGRPVNQRAAATVSSPVPAPPAPPRRRSTATPGRRRPV